MEVYQVYSSMRCTVRGYFGAERSTGQLAELEESDRVKLSICTNSNEIELF